MKTGISDSGLNLTRSRFLALPVVVPPPAEQRRIVEILEDHLSRLDAAERLLDDCQRRGKPLMRRLLIDACLGRGLGDSDRPTASVSAVEWGGAAPPRVSLPPGWRWQKWRDVGSSQNGRAFPSADYQASGLRLLRPGNLGLDGRLDWRLAATKCLPEIYRGSHADLLLRSGDLVMNLTAQSLKDDFLGRVCLVRETDEALLNQRLARLVPSAFSSAFAMIVFRSPLFRAHVSSLNAGSLIQHMFTKQIAEFWVPVPTPEDENRVVKRFGDQAGVGERLAMLDAQAARVQGLRRSLLSAAFSGRLTGEVGDHGGVGESARV
jgi:hypothetical protein